MESRLDGTVKRNDGRYDVHFERHIDAPVERLWAAVTEPDLLEGWLGGPVDELELTEGGNVVIQIHPKGPATVYGKVIRFDPLQVLELTWDVPAWRHIPDFFGTTMRWEVRPDGDGSKMLLTHSLPEETSWHVHAMLGAWHLHLDALPATVAGGTDPALRGAGLLRHAGVLRQPCRIGGVAAVKATRDRQSRSSRSTFPWAIFSRSAGLIGAASRNARPSTLSLNG